MRGDRGPLAHLLRPIIDQYRRSALGLIGCHSLGLERSSCELDVLVVSDEEQHPATLKIGEVYADLLFLKEKDILKPASPEFALSLSRVRAIRDTTLIISTASATNLAILEVNARRGSQGRLASAVKALGRADEALGKGATKDADFWLLSASYDFAYAWLYFKQVVPAPSHLLHQLKAESKGSGRAFEAFSKGAGLERASRSACAARLEGISVLQDVLRARQGGHDLQETRWATQRFEVLRRKADFLSASMDHAECQSFLGLEEVSALMALLAAEGGIEVPYSSMVISRLAEGKERVLGENLMRELGLTRDHRGVESALRVLKEQVSKLARRL